MRSGLIDFNPYVLTKSPMIAIRGTLLQTQSGYLLLPASTSAFSAQGPVAITGDLKIMSSLSMLHDGDFIVASGKYFYSLSTQAPQITIAINSIESIGLKSLLGKWRSNSGAKADFKSYTEVELQIPPKKPTVYKYILNIESNNSYSLFLAQKGDAGITLGSIILKDHSIEIRLVSANLGSYNNVISLERAIPATSK